MFSAGPALLLLLCLCGLGPPAQADLTILFRELEDLVGAVVDYFSDYEEGDDDSDEDYDVIDWLFNLLNITDECDPNPCLNGGDCEETSDGSNYTCTCPTGYGGRNCQKVTNHCKNVKCGRGQCVSTTVEPFYECKCKAPYLPPSCKKPSPCAPSPCLNGGTCLKGRTRTSFICVCPDNYNGQFCEVPPDDCAEGNGASYRGSVSVTEDGDECLYWTSFFLVDKGSDPFVDFEGDEGIGPHNHCRNPDEDSRPWCFIKHKGKLMWDNCNVTSCPILRSTAGVSPTESSSEEEPTPTPSTADFSTCGKPTPGAAPRIIGGQKSSPGMHPWQVSLQVRSNGPSAPFVHICGGILIRSCWVLTAAHCVDGSPTMQVVLGGVNIQKDEVYDQTLDVVEIISHENYEETPEALYNDVALLRLNTTDAEGHCARETRYVKTACLPSASIVDGTECIISGWGVTEKSAKGSSKLLHARVLLIPQDRCMAPKVYGDKLDQSMFCAGNMKGGVDSCQGDSGGPLTCKQNGTHYVYGVVSWGDSCGKKNKPGVYARVTEFLDWINSKIG